jgi:hypothetical protein
MAESLAVAGTGVAINSYNYPGAGAGTATSVRYTRGLGETQYTKNVRSSASGRGLLDIESGAQSRPLKFDTIRAIQNQSAFQPSKVLAVLRSFRDGDQREQQQSLLELMEALDRGRPEGQKIFPEK